MSSLRDTLRGATLGKAARFAKELVTIEGLEYEVRQPSLAQRGEILRLAGIKGSKVSETDIDPAKMSLVLVVMLTYVPGTDERVFELGDMAALAEYPAGSFVDKLAEVAGKLLRVDPEEAAKN